MLILLLLEVLSCDKVIKTMTPLTSKKNYRFCAVLTLYIRLVMEYGQSWTSYPFVVLIEKCISKV